MFNKYEFREFVNSLLLSDHTFEEAVAISISHFSKAKRCEVEFSNGLKIIIMGVKLNDVNR